MEFIEEKKDFVVSRHVIFPKSFDESLNATLSFYIPHSPWKQVSVLPLQLKIWVLY